MKMPMVFVGTLTSTIPYSLGVPVTLHTNDGKEYLLAVRHFSIDEYINRDVPVEITATEETNELKKTLPLLNVYAITRL